MHWRRKWQPTPVFLPGESQGRGSLVGCRLWDRTESDTTEAMQQQQCHRSAWLRCQDSRVTGKYIHAHMYTSSQVALPPSDLFLKTGITFSSLHSTQGTGLGTLLTAYISRRRGDSSVFSVFCPYPVHTVYSMVKHRGEQKQESYPHLPDEKTKLVPMVTKSKKRQSLDANSDILSSTLILFPLNHTA